MAGLNPIDLFIPEIKSFLRDKNYEDLKDLLAAINVIDLAEGLKQFSPEQQLLLLRFLKPDRLIAVFEELDGPQQEYVLQHLEDQTIGPLLEGIPIDAVARLVTKLPERTAKKMAGLMRKERVETVKTVLEFSPASAGAMMHVEFIPLSPDMTAKGAIEWLQRSLRVGKETTIHNLYVVNGGGRLVGALPLQTLIAAPPDIKIRDLMGPASVIKIPATVDREEAAKVFSRYKLISAPVVDDEGRLVGVLEADDIIKVIQQEDTEDIQKMAGVEALDEPYFKIGFFRMVKKRGAWLCVLFVGELLTATAMGFFEKEIERAVVLALFIPLIISSGGNSGSQAATLIVRAMALKEVNFKDWWRVIRREFASGMVLGTVLGVLGFLRIFLWSIFSDIYGPHSLLVALTVGSALILVVMWGTLSGSLLPIGLKRLGLDPAVVSAPFVATLVDVTGLVIYFSTALFILRGVIL